MFTLSAEPFHFERYLTILLGHDSGLQTIQVIFNKEEVAWGNK